MDRACGQPGAGAAAQFGVVEAVLTHCGSHDGRGASVVEGEGSHANPQATHHHGAHAPEKTQVLVTDEGEKYLFLSHLSDNT